MFNRSPKTPPNQVEGANPNSPERSKAPSAISKISSLAKSTALYLAALSATPTVSHAQAPELPPANLLIEPADRPDNTVQLGFGYMHSQKTFDAQVRLFFSTPNNTDEPYNSIIGLSYNFDLFRDNKVGLVIHGENVSLTPALNLKGSKGPDLNMFNYGALRLGTSHFNLQLGLAHLDPTEFRKLDTTILAPLFGFNFELSQYFNVHGSVAFPLPYAFGHYSSDDLNLNESYMNFARISAGASIHVDDFSVSIGLLTAHNGNPNIIGPSQAGELQSFHHSFLVGLSWEPGRTQAKEHTTRYSLGYNYDHPVTGSGPVIQAIAVHRPASLQSKETQNTNVAGSLDTLQKSCNAIRIDSSNTLDITTWTSRSFDKQKLTQYLDCQEISSFTLDLRQLDQFTAATKDRSGFKLTLTNSTNLRGKALAQALLKIPTIATDDITFTFEIDPLAKFETLKAALNTEQPKYHLSSHPDILFTESEQRFIQGGNDFNLDSAQHLFDPSKLPYANPNTKSITFGNEDYNKINADNALIHKGFVYSIKVAGQTYQVKRIQTQAPSISKLGIEEYMSVTYAGQQACTQAEHEHAPYLQTAVKAFAPILDKDITMHVGHHGGISFDGYTQGDVTLKGGSTRTKNEILNQAGVLSLEKTATTAIFQATKADNSITLKISLSYDATMTNPEFTITWTNSD